MSVIEIKDVKVLPDNFYTYEPSTKNQYIPIVIDNGSYKCRAGWASCSEPYLTFKNLLARPRKDRGRKDGETLVGNDILNVEAVRFQLKSPFDRNVVTQFEVQEQILDYIFSHLGIDTDGSVNHPILMTEPLLNPNYSRSHMSELLFEGYHVHGICYGIDSLFSFLNDCGTETEQNKSYALIVSCGYQCTHIIPVVNGSVDISKCKRIDVGGYHVTYYLFRLLQLKYPAHFNSITISKVEALLHDYGYVAYDYQDEVLRWADFDYYEDNVKRIQLPYTVVNTTVTPDQQREKRKEMARKLVEINARKRLKKLEEDEETLKILLKKQELLKKTHSSQTLKNILRSVNLSSVSELNKKINQLESKIQKVKQKLSSGNNEETPATTAAATVEEPKIKALKSEIQLPKDNEDLKSWLREIYKKRLDLLEKKNTRKQKRQEMSKRGTAAAQERMRLINQLARKDKDDDDFGLRDEDWDVYKAINREGGDTDSEEEQEKLAELEELLKFYDPMYTGDNKLPKDVLSVEEAYQLHFGLERLRAPEVLFQPYLIGCSQAGIAETMQFVLKSYNPDIADQLANNIFLTGGPTRLRGFVERIKKELLQMRPFKSTFRVKRSNVSPNLDAWCGARNFACGENFNNFITTYDEYREKGSDYLKEHFASNPYVTLPEPLPQLEENNTSDDLLNSDKTVIDD